MDHTTLAAEAGISRQTVRLVERDGTAGAATLRKIAAALQCAPADLDPTLLSAPVSHGAHTAESWNAAHPVGAAVRYWPVYPPIDGIPPVDTTTRSEAWTLGDGSVVVLVVGKTGGVHLSHVEVRHG